MSNEEENANNIINSLINQMNSVTYRLYSLEKILTKLHSEKKLKGAVDKAEKEITIELQGQNNPEAQDSEGEVGIDDSSGNHSISLDRCVDGEDEISSEQAVR